MVEHSSESTYYVPGTALGTPCAFMHIFTTKQGRKYPHFANEETETQRGLWRDHA